MTYVGHDGGAPALDVTPVLVLQLASASGCAGRTWRKLSLWQGNQPPIEGASYPACEF